MKHLGNKNRKALRNKMSIALSENMVMLSGEMQDIMVDDLVTAFENRVSALNQAQSKAITYNLRGQSNK